jgi:hypothetical protein
MKQMSALSVFPALSHPICMSILPIVDVSAKLSLHPNVANATFLPFNGMLFSVFMYFIFIQIIKKNATPYLHDGVANLHIF